MTHLSQKRKRVKLNKALENQNYIQQFKRSLIMIHLLSNQKKRKLL